MDRNISIIFWAIHISIKTITFKKFQCCRDAPVNCLVQLFCHYFYNCCYYFSTLTLIFTLLISLVVILYLLSNFCWLYVYFHSVYLKRTTCLAQEKAREKKVVQFFQNSIVYWLFKFVSAMRRCANIMPYLHGFLSAQQLLC